MKKIKYYSQQHSGFSIIEVLISVMVVGMALTALATSLSYSIALTNQARYRDVASKKAQEGLDFFKRERVVLGWNLFHTNISDAGYCLSTIPESVSQPPDSIVLSSLPTGSCGVNQFDISVEGVGPNFKREVYITKGATDEPLIITVAVSWPGGSGDDHVVEIQQELYQW